MTKRIALAVALLSVVATVGCSATGGSGATTPKTADAGARKKAASGPTALPVTSAGEKAALAAAKTDAGRKWANGPTSSVGPVMTEPFLAGYVFILHDSKQQYRVRVLGEQVVPLAQTGDAIPITPYVESTRTVAPTSLAEKAALAAATQVVTRSNPAATQGAIERYEIFFPKGVDGLYPVVSIYAVPTKAAEPFASGGHEK